MSVSRPSNVCSTGIIESGQQGVSAPAGPDLPAARTDKEASVSILPPGHDTPQQARPCRLLNCPITHYGLCTWCGFRADPDCVIEVCRYCYSTNLRGANHGVSVSDGTEDGSAIACLWFCNHQVQDREERCLACHPYTDAEKPF